MSWYDRLINIPRLRKALLDEESQKIFDARIDYLCTRNEENYLNTIDSIPKKWRCEELNRKINGKSEIIIFGCGCDGLKQKRVLDLCNIELTYWRDNNLKVIGTEVNGKTVLSVDEVIQQHKESLIIIGSRKYANEMYEDLKKGNVSDDNILKSEYGILVANSGNQYFDVFEPIHDEVFIDAGAYNGDTILDYFEWVDGKNKKVYAMEPIKEMAEHIVDMINEKKINHVILENVAAWNKQEKVRFNIGGAGSYINDAGEIEVNAIDMDTMVNNDKVTYIKMDIEGSELKSLEGAQNIIKKYVPRLAICIYHKPEDIILIEEYILSLNADYHFYIRHYASNMWETVLYAVPKYK